MDNFKKIVCRLTLFLVFMVGTSTTLLSQNTVRGKVVDQNDEALIGVNVLVKGTEKGTATDLEGNFTLEDIDENAVLIVSYIGYQQMEVPVAKKSNLKIILLSDSQLLDEIVVVGYGAKKSTSLTGSISIIQPQELKANPVGNVTKALQGNAPGVSVTSSNTPGSNAKIRIRGLSTINNNNPLWIIDGVYASDLNSVNPSDIESITVLKDAASTAIYGARGANGVVLVTTLRGVNSQKPRINFNMRLGTLHNSKKYEMLNPQEFGEMIWLSYKNSGVKPQHPQYGTGDTPIIPKYVLPAGSRGDVNLSLYDRRDFPITEADAVGTDWFEELYQAGSTQDYNVSLTSGSENSSYGIGLGYMDERGMVIKTGFKRYTLRTNSRLKVNKWLDIGENIGISYTNDWGYQGDGGAQTPFNEAIKIGQMMPVRDVMGNWSAPTRAVGFDANYHPIARQYYRENHTNKTFGVIGSIDSKIIISPLLSVKTLFGVNFRDSRSRGTLPTNPESYVARTQPELSEGSNILRSYNWTNTLNFNKSFGGIHLVEALLGTESVSNSFRSLSASRKGFFLTSENYMILNSGEEDQLNNGDHWENSTMSYFGNIHYENNKKYLLDITGRYDGSSRFSKANRWGFFPSVALGWVISNEEFLLNNTAKWMDFLKLRISWGKSGNDRIGNYNGFTTFQSNDTYSYYPITGSNSQLTSGIESAAYGNANAKWETTTSFNIGVDAYLFNLFDFHIDIWQRNTEDMLYPKRIPAVVGNAAFPSINIGDMTNTGIDFNVSFQGSALEENLSYSITANLSHYKNRLDKLSNVKGEVITGGFTRAESGRSFPEFYGYKVIGIFQSESEAENHPDFIEKYNKPGRFKYADVNADNILNSEDRTYIGSPHPDLLAGFNFNVEYKEWFIGANFYSSIGNDVVNADRTILDFYVREFNRGKRRLYESWGSPYLENNEDAKMPLAELNESQTRQASSYFVENGSYLRLENMQIGYNLPEGLLNKIKLTNFRIYLMGTNLFTVTGFSGLDPSFESGDRSFGVYQSNWATPKRYLVGANITF